MIKGLSHVAVAVPNVDEAARFYEGQLGLRLSGRETVPGRRVTVGFIEVGNTRIELVQPDSPDSPIAKFLAQRGPGLQHICFEVDDVDAEFARLKAAGVRMTDDAPKPGAHGTRVTFVHPSSTGGVLIELSQPPGA
ncbi:methylmalonyl-CoA epimerase [candidate division WOR-3 bacterium]|nr:methylmalonyl-CoA epimerase [candidate division WOR-3 bacterium]